MMHNEQPSQIKKRPPKPTPTKPRTPVDVSDKTKPTYFDGVPTIEAEMKPCKLPVYDAEFFEPSAKHPRGLGLGLHIALMFVLLTALLIAVIGWMMT